MFIDTTGQWKIILINNNYIPLTNRIWGLYCKLWTEFFPLQFMALQRSWAINRRGKNKDPQLTVQTKKTRFVRYLLYPYCVPSGFGIDFHSRGTASNFWTRLKAKRVNLKLFLSHWHALVHNLEWKKVFNCYLLHKLRKFNDKSRNSLATKTTINFSDLCRRVQPTKLTNHSVCTNLEI